jgi:tetratricopeptide (TPR) repeat protein
MTVTPATASPNARHVRRRAPRAVAVCAAAALVIVGAAWLSAPDEPGRRDGVETFVPLSPAEAVERLPGHAAASKRDLKARLARERSQPPDLASAVGMARRHYDRARADGEPRELGLAQAALGSWWDQPDAPVPVLLVRAAIRQYQHDFAGSLADLGQAISADPANAQAWLSRAAVQQTIGDLDQAAASCAKVVQLSNHVAGHVCVGDVASLRGDAGALAAIEQRLMGQRLDGPGHGWIRTVQAEMAERLGRDEAADRYFRAAIGADPGSYPRVAYADFLMRRGRHADVVALLDGAAPTDAVVLRRAIALKLDSDPRAKVVADELRQRFTQAADRDDSLHLREMARFALDVAEDAGTALALAQRNWLLQKEPADALLLARAARAAESPQAADPVREFTQRTGMIDGRLDALL